VRASARARVRARARARVRFRARVRARVIRVRVRVRVRFRVRPGLGLRWGLLEIHPCDKTWDIKDPIRDKGEKTKKTDEINTLSLCVPNAYFWG
jgi:hypothetical protein